MKIRPQPPIEKITGRESPSSAASSKTTAKPAAGFSTGQLLSGRVLSIESDGTAVLDIDGRKITAFSAVRLPLGEEVELVVSKGGDTPWLTLRNQGPAQQLFRLLVTDAVGRFMENYDSQAMADLSSRQAAPSASLASLASLLSNMQTDAVPSLDHLLFSLLSFNQAKSAKFPTSLIPHDKELLQLLAHLEKNLPQQATETGSIRQFVALQQAFLNLNQQSTNNLLFIVPLFFAGKSGWGEWLVRQEKEKSNTQAEGGTALRFDFFLHLSRLGEMQLSLLVKKHSLQGTFFLEDAGKVEYITARLQELRNRLVGLEFETPTFSCRIADQSNQLRLKNLFEEHLNINNLTLIDLTA